MLQTYLIIDSYGYLVSKVTVPVVVVLVVLTLVVTNFHTFDATDQANRLDARYDLITKSSQ